jgi:hypothetical protein
MLSIAALLGGESELPGNPEVSNEVGRLDDIFIFRRFVL